MFKYDTILELAEVFYVVWAESNGDGEDTASRETGLFWLQIPDA